MKSTTDILFMLMLGFVTFVTLSCEEQAPVVNGIEPYFKIRFINQDSLEQLDSGVIKINKKINVIDDSLNSIELRSDNGDETDYTEKIDSLNIANDSLVATKNLFNEIINTIKSGRVQITKLSGEGGAGDVIFEDSLSVYRFPLNTHADSSQFYITIGDETDTLKATYRRETIVEERVVLINAIDFKVIDNTFDDLKISQSDSINFSSNEATVTVYF